MGWEKLQGYYCKANNYIYAAATAMDPRAKYEWWEEEGWNDDEFNWCRFSIKLVQDLWLKHAPTQEQQESRVPAANSMTLFKRKRPRTGDQLAAYVNEPTIDDVDNVESQGELVLGYWKAHEKRWPELANMARRYLAVPASSAASERVFSRAKFFVPSQRNRLGAEGFKSSLLLEAWQRLLQEVQIEEKE